ncbi:pilus assembly protein CpaC [Novimethylophilus kurashikiensis]|uniref:Pilus assembly protein CpaC n=1 Tax=Novimethylophilus kurashikiensis TaxID=1825523 RepID=A0A2R5F8Z7_9PROT|nr:type II and III secretion system protein family protein [Novimethylophilus kurashikiensis]GBG13151.1 pilus assembly protein CpaC [Novimethylophilus kurashikiensis]
MNKHHQGQRRWPAAKALLSALGMTLAMLAAAPQYAQAEAADANTVELAPQVNATLGKSTLLRLPAPAARVSVGDKEVADVILINPKEIYLLGKKLGATNLIVWGKGGQSTIVDILVGMDSGALQNKLTQLLPREKGIQVSTAGDSLVLSGTVGDSMGADKALMIAEAYAGKKVVNMLKVAGPQQVMLEVKMAEVSKNLLDKLGAQLGATAKTGGVHYLLTAGFLSLTGANPLSPGGLITITDGKNTIKIDAENKDGVVKILAEPNIMAISGQEGSFLAGGKVLIPVAQTAASGSSSITLEEKEFGVGLKFTPTVLEGDVINLRVAPEVSELSQTGTAVSIGSNSSVLPSFTTRRASTTVQLRDGQSFAIAGLIKSNVTESIRRFPLLGDIPVLGTLFRSSEFQHDKTELLFVITPRLVKPLPPNYALPTDSFKAPTPAEFFLNGKLENKPAAPENAAAEPDKSAKEQPEAAAPAAPSDSTGFEMK